MPVLKISAKSVGHGLVQYKNGALKWLSFDGEKIDATNADLLVVKIGAMQERRPLEIDHYPYFSGYPFYLQNKSFRRLDDARAFLAREHKQYESRFLRVILAKFGRKITPEKHDQMLVSIRDGVSTGFVAIVENTDISRDLVLLTIRDSANATTKQRREAVRLLPPHLRRWKVPTQQIA